MNKGRNSVKKADNRTAISTRNWDFHLQNQHSKDSNSMILNARSERTDSENVSFKQVGRMLVEKYHCTISKDELM